MNIRQFSMSLVMLAGMFAFAGSSQAVPTTTDAPVVPTTDFVFIIDATASMAGEIAGVRNGFSQFVSDLDAAGADARYSIVLFGGDAELVLDLTSDATAAQTALNSIVIGASSGFQNNHNVNPEAGLEAIRMVLGEAPSSELVNNNIDEDGFLDFRSDARINLVLVTDEDSDRPFRLDNRYTNQTSNEPPSTINDAWQAEVDATAQAVIDNDAYLNMLINIGDNPSRSQYGDYTKDVSDSDLLNFNAEETLNNLLADSLTDESLQAQVLGAGLVARSFNVAGANNPTFVANFFNAKLEEVIDDPGVSVPEPSLLALLSIGLVGIGFARRKA